MTLRIELEGVTHKAVAKYDQHPLGRQLFAGTLPEIYYKGLLVQIAKYVAESAALLETAGRRLAASDSALSALLLQKAEEEKGHELWAYDDLSALAVTRAAAEAVPLARATACYLAFNDWIVEEYPAGFLGTALVLETLSVERAELAANNLRKHSRIPNVKNALSFLERHGRLDEGHVEELLSILETMPRKDLITQVTICAEVVGFVHPSLIVAYPEPLELAS